jgi:hypothetical protein
MVRTEEVCNVTDYSDGLIRARDLLKLTEEQAALGNLGQAQATILEALIAVAQVRDALRELAERQNVQRGS